MDLSFFSKPAVIWFLVGIVFLLLEFMIPGLIVVFFGIGAVITAIASLLFDLSVNVQLIIFISTSVASLVLLRKNFKKVFVGKKENEANEILEEFIGKKAVAATNISKGVDGKVIFKGANWEAESDEDIKKGDNVIIESKESIKFKVKILN